MTRPLLCLALAALAAGCAPAAPVPNPSATAFVVTRVAAILTASAATQEAPTPAAPTATLSAPTPTRSRAPGPTVTATPAAPTAAPTQTAPLVPTLDLGLFPRPPADFGGEAHFLFRRPIGEGGNVFPASSYRYGSTYGNQLATHHGVEFGNPQGAPVVAVADGTVYFAGSDAERQFGPSLNFYGNLVVLLLNQAWDGQPVFAVYGHMDSVGVQAGQAVAAGELLGTVGATGVALGPHLHLEVRVANPDSYAATRNPELWLAPAGGAGSVAVRVTNDANQYLPGRRVEFRCADGARRFVDTYWDPGVNPDDGYGENAAVTDVPAGRCLFETTYLGQTLRATLDLQPGALNFVWLRP